LVICDPPALQALPCVSLPQIAAFERDSAVFEGKTIHFPGRRHVGASHCTRCLDPVHKVEHAARLGGRSIDNLLKDKAGWGLARPNGHFDFTLGRVLPASAARLLLRFGIEPTIKAARKSKAELPLDLLRRTDRAVGFPFAVPQLTIQPDPTPDEVDVVKCGVAVSDRNELVTAQTHQLHEPIRDGPPLIVR
jgi:hypothetical protein